MKPGRLSCLVPFCRRTTGKPFAEWICADHWRLVSKRTKARRRIADRIRARAAERADDQYAAQGGIYEAQYQRYRAACELADALWQRCRDEAIQQAAGI